MPSWSGVGSTKSLAATGSVEIAVGNRKSLSVNVTGTWAGTLVVEVSPNGGSDAQVVSGGTWVAVRFFDPNLLTFASSITANGTYVIPDLGGMTHARVRCSAYTSGTIVIEEHAVETLSQVVLAQLIAGSANLGALTAGEAHVGEVGGVIPWVTQTFSRPADNTAYTIGDLIGNSGTANLVVPIIFTPARISGGSGRLIGATCVVTPASGNLIIANLAFDLLLFRPATSIPFAAAGYPADNAALVVSAAAQLELVAVFSFLATGWRSGAGSVTAAGASGRQSVPLADGRSFAAFNLASIPAQTLLGLAQVQAAWTPTGVVNQFDFRLDVEGN